MKSLFKSKKTRKCYKRRKVGGMQVKLGTEPFHSICTLLNLGRFKCCILAKKKKKVITTEGEEECDFRYVFTKPFLVYRPALQGPISAHSSDAF